MWHYMPGNMHQQVFNFQADRVVALLRRTRRAGRPGTQISGKPGQEGEALAVELLVICRTRYLKEKIKSRASRPQQTTRILPTSSSRALDTTWRLWWVLMQDSRDLKDWEGELEEERLQ